MMHKAARIGVWVLMLALFAMLGPVFAAETTESSKGKKYFWKMANPSPRGICHAIAFEKILVPAMEKATNGELGYKMYWGGVMGDDTDMIQKMRIGQLQACGLSGMGTCQICPEMNVMSLPFMFNNYDEVDYIKKKMFPTFDKSAREHGFQLLFIIDQGFDLIFSTTPQISTPEEMKKTRFLSWGGPMEMTWMHAMGISPINVKVPEMPASLRQGVYNTLQIAGIWVVATQTFSTLRYVNPLRIRYSPASPVASNAAWEKLPQLYRQRLMEGRSEMERQYAAVTRKADDKAVEALMKYGLAVRESNKAAMDEMKKRTRPVWDEMAGKYYSRKALEEIVALLAEFRQKGCAYLSQSL